MGATPSSDRMPDPVGFGLAREEAVRSMVARFRYEHDVSLASDDMGHCVIIGDGTKVYAQVSELYGAFRAELKRS